MLQYYPLVVKGRGFPSFYPVENLFCFVFWLNLFEFLETNRDHSVLFEIASKYCILDSSVDHDGYSISSEGFLPAIVDIAQVALKAGPLSPGGCESRRTKQKP